MVIYKTTNLINGKYYIGKQKKFTDGYFGSGTALKSAVKKYGRLSFKKEILEICDNEISLQERELFWLDKCNAVKDKQCYNLVRETSSNNHRSYKDPNYRKRLSEAVKVAMARPEVRAKILKNNNGENHPALGTKKSDEFKKLISNIHKGKILSEETKSKIRKYHIGKKISSETRNKMTKTRRQKCDTIIIKIVMDGNEITFNNRYEFKQYIEIYNNGIPRGRVRGNGNKRINYNKAVQGKYNFVKIIPK